MTTIESHSEMVHPQSMSYDTKLPSSIDASAASTAPKPRDKVFRRNRAIHSCLECRRRKMKCDRANPCQNCCASQQQCVYVTFASSEAQFSQRLTEMKEARDAIDETLREGLDDHIKTAKGDTRRKRPRRPEEVLSDDSETSADEGYLEATPLAVQDAAYADEADDDVEDLGFRIGKMRIGERIGGLYRPRIADEILASLQQSSGRFSQPIPPPMIPGTTEELLRPGPLFTAPSIDLLFSRVSSRDTLTQYLPPRSMADKLMDCYWDAVHPVARIVHRPSFAQRYETLWETMENGYEMAPSLAAIVYSVLFSASVAVSEAQVSELFQTSRQNLKDSLQLGTELALGQAHLLRASKIETVQAFAAYLLPMCLNEISRAHSVLTGTLIRLAECMGLHRDPTEFKFSPAECQTRRLVWYQVCYLDLKTSSVQGPRPFIRRDGYTTQLPLEISSFRGSFESYPVWNDMIFSMIRFECQEMHRRNISFRNRLDQKRLSLSKAISKIGAFCAEMDAKYGPYLNVASPSPMQRMSSLVLKLFSCLYYIHILSRYMTSVAYRIPDRLRQIVLIKGTEALEAAVELESAKDLQKWAWYSSSSQGYHTAFLLLFEVFNFPMRREASRIWNCLDFIFADALSDFPSLEHKGAAPSIQEIVAHRDRKARYLLMMIVTHMRAYQKVKGLKVPVQLKDSIIVVAPQKFGEDSDPRMPLNYAHGEPEAQSNARDDSISSIGVMHGHVGAHSEKAQSRTGMLRESGTGPVNEYVSGTGGASSGASPPWIQFREPRFVGNSNPILHSSPHNHPISTISNQSASMAHGEVYGQTDDIDPQMLEIDWSLWDTIFPPQINDGNLDISDNGSWSISDILTYQERTGRPKNYAYFFTDM